MWGAVEPPWPRRRAREPDEVDQIGRGAAPVQHLDQVGQRIPAMVARGDGHRCAPLTQLLVERSRMLRQRQGAEVAEAYGPLADVVPAVRDADEFTADLLEIPLRIVSQGEPLTVRQRAQARA